MEQGKYVHGWIILKYLMFCLNPLLPAAPYNILHAHADHCAIRVSLNFYQMSMIHIIEREKAKHIYWKF